MKFRLFILLIFSQLVAFGQLTFKITSDRGNDTVKTCEDTVITFYADVKLNGITPDSVYIYWNFDDGDYEEGPNLDTIEHTFHKNGGYRVFAYAKLDSLYAYDVFEIQIGLKPKFDDTHTNLKEDEGLCKGDKLILTGKVQTKEWKEKRSATRIETFPVFIDTTHDYRSSLLFRNYPLDSLIIDSSNINKVGVYVEHSAAQNIKITLECPIGKKIILKDYGGNAFYLGEPVLDAHDYSEGKGYWYYFKNDADIQMNAFTGNDTLPEGDYLPQESFNKLAGCPLDGLWYIKVEQQNADTANGYGFGWMLQFNNQQDTLKFSNLYDITHSVWTGDKINVTSDGVASAYPEKYGEHRYYFFINDDYGCLHDTSLLVEVEKPDFSVDKYTVYIADSIKVEDKTSWSKQWEWDFGDESPIETEKSVYHKYFEKDTFLITMTVYSESGCSDFDTARIVVQPKPIEIEKYNIFTPNGDGVNDVFSFFNTNDEKIIAYNIETIKGRIYNRYGKIVCKWNTPEEAIKGWDGTINNNGIMKAPSGFYYYVLIIKGKDGKKYKPFTGTIYLYRDK